MALLEHRTRIAIADESDSAEQDHTHGMVDLAAALAWNAWNATPLAHVLEELEAAFQEVLPMELADPLGELEYTREEAIRYGTRLGFALARTLSTADRGWAAWLAEAESWLRGAECGVAAHQKTPIAYMETFNASIQTVKATRLSQEVMPSSGEPPEAYIAAIREVADMAERVTRETLDEHVREHHGEPGAAAPKSSAPSSAKERVAGPLIRPEILTRAARATAHKR